MVVNALSVDVEDWFHVYALEPVVAREDWLSLEHRVEANTDRVLALFDEARCKATFFTLGWVAELYPALMRRITHAGHELASHGWDHQRVYTMGPEQFRTDLARARAALEDATGVQVRGYRAPSFSIDARTPWAHGVLAESGYAYSSSVAPIRHDHYGWPESPRFAHRPVAGSDFIELPVTVGSFLGRSIPTGGGFFRLFPNKLTDLAIRQLNDGETRPAMFYFHPWEVDPGQPRIAGTPLRSRLRHYSRLSSMAGKLSTLARTHRWDRVDRIVAAEAARLQ